MRILALLMTAVMAIPNLARGTRGPEISPKPRVAKWSKERGSLTPVRYICPAEVRDKDETKLLKKFVRKFPRKEFPAEGYIMRVGPEGTLVISPDGAGQIRARQTLRQLEATGEPVRQGQMADWPSDLWRGFHLMPYTPKALPVCRKIVKDWLVPLKCNAFIFQIDYHFEYKSHPEVAEEESFTKEQIREFVAECRQEGIEVIPLLNCLGHQSWKADSVGKLLRAHPEFEEIPDAARPQADLDSKRFYCRSWCPLHPEVNKLIFDLMDELIDAFECKSFHLGMDETFVLASQKCPRCNGKDPAELFARSINDLYGHLSEKGQTVMLWGDRLLDSETSGYGIWEASDMGTHRAIDMIPKDIVICDWHYSAMEEYPSLETFTDKGFRVIPTIYRSPKGARLFTEEAREMKNPLILGPMSTVWCSAMQLGRQLFPGSAVARINPETGEPLPEGEEAPGPRGGEKLVAAAADTLASAWNPKSPPTAREEEEE